MNSNVIDVQYYKHPIFTEYAATENGDIYSMKFDKIRLIKQCKKPDGYPIITLYSDSKCKKYRANRFVFECINNRLIDKNKEIDHINHDKTDNRIENLREVSRTTNILNRFNNKEIEKLPDDAIKIIEYNSHHYNDYYFSPTTNCIYKYSDGYLFEIPFKSHKTENNNRVYYYYTCSLTDVNKKSTSVSLNTLRKKLGYD